MGTPLLFRMMAPKTKLGLGENYPVTPLQTPARPPPRWPARHRCRAAQQGQESFQMGEAIRDRRVRCFVRDEFF